MSAADNVRAVQRDMALRDEIRLMRAENEVFFTGILTMMLALNTEAEREDIVESVEHLRKRAQETARETVAARS